MAQTYLFEILLEEIPAWMLPARLDALRERLTGLVREFAERDPDPATIAVGATSRRIWFHLRDLPERQPDRSETVKGPSARAAFDAEGNPTRALDGFLRKNGATREQIAVRDDYVWLERTVTGRTMDAALRDGVPAIVESLHWPKTMRWSGGEKSYIRPVHSVVSILDGKLLPLMLLGVEAGTTARGHRVLADREIEVGDFASYRDGLAAMHVVIDPENRAAELRRRATSLAAEAGGTPGSDGSILDQWTYLTEAPGVVRAEFDPAFLSLPFEVLVTVMRVHQKQLPVWKGDRLTSSFLAVMDQTGDPDGNVATGNAFVTNARFADAKFFHETDRRLPLEERVPALVGLTFQEKLGTYLDKTERIVALARAIAEELDLPDRDAIERAARLAKADLVTEMVKEFTELQGKIGGIYAREEGAPAEVWQAIYDHYLPVNVEDDLPRTIGGAVVSLADKIDTLAGFFRIGMKPTGSKDPFALRRAGQGAVQILLQRKPWRLELPVQRLIELALDVHGIDSDARTTTSDELRDFLGDRVRTLMEHPRYGGVAYDEIAAAMESGWQGSLPDLQDRLTALRSARRWPEFLSILDAAKRIRNIAGEEASTAVDDALLAHPTEKRLADLSAAVVEQIDELVAARQYEAALESFAAMAPELETFFDDVLVMVEDERVRKNRIGLLNRVGFAARRIAEVTRIVVDRRDYNSRP